MHTNVEITHNKERVFCRALVSEVPSINTVQSAARLLGLHLYGHALPRTTMNDFRRLST